MSKRVAITGIGAVAAGGVGREVLWRGLRSAASFLRPIDRFDTAGYTARVAGTVQDFHAEDHIPRRIIAQTDRWTHFDLFCAGEALADAGIEVRREDPTRIGLVMAASTGGNEFGQRELHACWAQGPQHVSVYQSIAWFYAASNGQISIRFGIRGYGRTICAEAAGGLMALAHATRLIRRGICDVVLTGGAEAPVAPFILACHQAAANLSPEAGADAYRPFDAGCSGIVVGEGGAMLVLEDRERALARGARLYGEVLGCASTYDGRLDYQPAPDGTEYARAIAGALQQAGTPAAAVDWVLADGQATAAADQAEARALHRALGPALQRIPVSAPKSMVGRLFAGASPLDLATALLGMRDQVILPTVNHRRTAAACAFDCVPNAPRPARLRRVLVAGRGFGGFNAAVLLGDGSD